MTPGPLPRTPDLVPTIFCIVIGVLGVVGGIWLASDQRAASVAGGVVIALLSLVPILFGVVLLAYIASP